MAWRPAIVMLFGALLLGASPAGDLENYSYRVWGAQDGLPEETVQAITQTPDGYLWVGTSGGLARYDGFQFTVFNRANTPAFRDDSVQALYPDGDSLWIGTEGGGLLRFEKGTFQHFGRESGLTDGFIRAVRRDRRGTLWVGTDVGLFRWNGRGFDRVDGRDGVPAMAVHDIAEERSGKLWVGGSALFLLDGRTAREVRFRGWMAQNTIKSLLQSRDGTLWVGTVAGLHRIAAGDPVRDPVQVHPEGHGVYALLEDHDGSVWAGWHGRGWNRYLPGDWRTLKSPGLLPGDIFCLFEDAEFNLWAGTTRGLVRISREIVNTVTPDDGGDHSVLTVYPAPDGAVWLVTQYGLFRQYGEHLTRFHVPGAGGPFRVRNVLIDRRGDLLIGTGGWGFLRVRGTSVTRYTSHEGLVNDFIRVFHEDRKGALWIGTDNGISKWDGQRLRNFRVQEGLAYGSVRDIHELANGDLWIGTDGGVSLLRNDAFVDDPILHRVGPEKVWTIYEDPEGTLWFGTRGGGLFRVRQGTVTRFTTADGLPTDSIYQILPDAKGDMWISSGAGLFRINPGRLVERAQAYGEVVSAVDDGLEIGGINGGRQPAGCRTASGEIWFPSTKGAVRIQPEIVLPKHRLPIVLEQVLADGHSVRVAPHLTLPPGEGRLEIHYTAPSMRAPVHFRYRLVGFDRQWTDAGSRRVASYTNLAPGYYEFRVVAMTMDGTAGNSETSLAVDWRPHLYQTVWFRVACALMGVLLVAALLRLRLNETHRRYQAVLTERNRLAREMHDTLIQGCVGVSTLLEAASTMKDASPSPIDDLLDRARAEIRATLDEARHAVWEWRQTSADRQDLCLAVRQIALQAGAHNGFSIQTEIQGASAPLDLRAERALLLVAKEALRNVVAHAKARNVLVRLTFSQFEAEVEIADDGCGFDSQADLPPEDGHFGIVGMKERVQELGGRFSIASQPGRGTTVRAKFPLLSAKQTMAGAV